MPKKDIFHDNVKNALIKDGWTITHDPLTLRIGKKRLFVDLGASRLISAEKGTRKIAVEIKSFIGVSDMHDMELALGQYVLYRKILDQQEPDRALYISVEEEVYNELFNMEVGQLLLSDRTIRLVAFDAEKEVITRWIPDWK